MAKSNFSGLRYREPIHRTLRELVLSYFEQYYNIEGEKTLRGYTVPMNLALFDRDGWMVDDVPLEAVAARLDRLRRFTLLSPSMEKGLSLLDERSLKAGLIGSNEAGLWRPMEKK